MTVTNSHLRAGDSIILMPGAGSNHDGTSRIIYDGTNGSGLFTAGEAYPLTRVSLNYLWVRIPARYESDGNTTVQISRNAAVGENGWTDRNASYQLITAEYQNRPRPRKLGTTPTDGDVIAIDDPRVQWIWEDLAAYATRQHWCSQYDQLAEGVGIPGRTRTFSVSRRVGNLDIRASFEARSEAEAEAMLTAELAAPMQTAVAHEAAPTQVAVARSWTLTDFVGAPEPTESSF